MHSSECSALINLPPPDPFLSASFGDSSLSGFVFQLKAKSVTMPAWVFFCCKNGKNGKTNIKSVENKRVTMPAGFFVVWSNNAQNDQKRLTCMKTQSYNASKNAKHSIKSSNSWNKCQKPYHTNINNMSSTSHMYKITKCQTHIKHMSNTCHTYVKAMSSICQPNVKHI